ncbi:MAG TPA: ABC transporter permease [Candidatus Didemnitutus sp.]|nr:ABC transporter permease [Candidatus Didemnitutus sp.]
MMFKGIYAVVLIDLKRFWLDRARIAMGLLQPLLYLFVLGAGIGSSSQLGGGRYQQFIFPGVIGLSMLFTATFAAISIVFDRQIGFFKAVLVAPVPRPAIALGKIAAGSLQAAAQGAIVLPFAPLAGVPVGLLEVLRLIGAMLLASTTFAAIGLAFASRFKSVTVFPVVSNAVLLPMFFLSGAMYPLTVAPRWMQVAAHFDPVAYGVDLMRGALSGSYFFSPWLSVAVLVAVITGLAAESVRVLNRGEDDSSLGSSARVWGRK